MDKRRNIKSFFIVLTIMLLLIAFFLIYFMKPMRTEYSENNNYIGFLVCIY